MRCQGAVAGAPVLMSRQQSRDGDVQRRCSCPLPMGLQASGHACMCRQAWCLLLRHLRGGSGVSRAAPVLAGWAAMLQSPQQSQTPGGLLVTPCCTCSIRVMRSPQVAGSTHFWGRAPICSRQSMQPVIGIFQCSQHAACKVCLCTVIVRLSTWQLGGNMLAVQKQCKIEFSAWSQLSACKAVIKALQS